MNATFINPNVDGAFGINIGLAYVMSSVKYRHNVRLLDITFHSRDYMGYIRKEIERHKPDIAAFSVTSFSFQRSLSIGSMIKEIYPEVSLIFGGVHPTLLPEETLSHPLVDAICIGEGEKAFTEYLDKLERGKAPEVDGIWYKDKKGRMHKNRLRPYEENIDALPFPNWDHWEIDKYLNANLYYLPGAIKFLSSRGCPYDCSFCSNGALRETIPGRYYRTRSAENIIEEIKINRVKYKKLGFNSIAFGDDIFGLDYEQLKRFSELYIKEGLSKEFAWVCGSRADIISERWAKTASEANCKMIMLGVESGDDYIRTQVYKKRITGQHIAKAVSNLRKNNIEFGFYMLVGCPQDSRKTLLSTIKMVKEFRPITTCFNFYQPLPKTRLAGALNNRIWEQDRDFRGYWNKPRIRTVYLKRRELYIWMLYMNSVRIYEFFKLGIVLRKLNFILDVSKYIFNLPKRLFFMGRYIHSDLEERTLLRHIFYKPNVQR